MSELLLQSLEKKVHLTSQEFHQFADRLTVKSLKRKEHLLTESEVDKHIAFVEQGVLRSYLINQEGEAVTVQFALEGYWIADLYSFFSAKPAIYNIEALEKAKVLLLDQPSFQEACDTIPAFERFFRILIQNAYVAAQERIAKSYSQRAEERYIELMHTHPDILRRVSQHYIASYLGIKPQSLSRIRKRMSTPGRFS